MHNVKFNKDVKLWSLEGAESLYFSFYVRIIRFVCTSYYFLQQDKDELSNST